MNVPSSQNIVYNSQNNSPKRANNTVIHRRDSGVHLRRPKTEEHNYRDINDSICVNEFAQNAREMERAPDQLVPRTRSFSFCTIGVVTDVLT
jgi:hypothetical protein